MEALNKKKKIKCYYCNRLGHIKRYCPKMTCFLCGRNHMKKHCGYFLELRYREWKKMGVTRLKKLKDIEKRNKQLLKELIEIQTQYQNCLKILKETQRSYDDYLKTTNKKLRFKELELQETKNYKDELIELKRKLNITAFENKEPNIEYRDQIVESDDDDSDELNEIMLNLREHRSSMEKGF